MEILSTRTFLPMGNRPLPELIKEHKQLVAKIAELEAQIDRERTAVLATLPASFGYPDLDSFIKALVQACRQPRRRKIAQPPREKRKSVKAEIGGGMAKAAKSAQAPAEPLRPSGTSLDDPKNFGMMPDPSLLAATNGDAQAHQSRLSEALKFAQRVLHTSGVPAAVWREWRQFERKAGDALRTLNSVVHTEED